MGAAFRVATAAGTSPSDSNSSVTVPVGAGVVAGDVLACYLSITGTSTSVTCQDWVEAAPSVQEGSGPPHRGALFVRTAQADEPASWTFAWQNGLGNAAASMIAVSGATLADVVASLVVHGGSGTDRQTAAIVAPPGAVLVSFFGDRSGSAWTTQDMRRSGSTVQSSASCIGAAGTAVGGGTFSRTAVSTSTTSVGSQAILAFPAAESGGVSYGLRRYIAGPGGVRQPAGFSLRT